MEKIDKPKVDKDTLVKASTIARLGAIMVVLGFVALVMTLVANFVIMKEIADVRSDIAVAKGDVAAANVRIGQMEQWANSFSQAVVQGFQQIGAINSTGAPTNPTN